MAAFLRLQQRIKENFQETTRDISLLAGGNGSSNATYFDTSDDKIKEIAKLLDSRVERERLEGMKRIIAGMSKGRDMEPFFAQVVKNVVAPSIEIRKLVYIYLLRFASTNSDLLLLSINTFQKDLSDPSPLIRSMSLRVLTSIRVQVIQGIVMLGLKKLVQDRNPWVRKTVAGGLAKFYEMDSSSLSQIIPLLQTLLSSPSPLTLGATLTAFTEICPDRLDLLHPYYRHLCRSLVDADEWGQVVALDILTRYARSMLEKPQNAGSVSPTSSSQTAKKDTEESDDEFEGLDIDLAMLLHCAKPLFQSRNPSVILATGVMYYHLAPASHTSVGQPMLVAPLMRLASSSSGGKGGLEMTALTWEVIASMTEERRWLFNAQYSTCFVQYGDVTSVKLTKIRTLIALVTKENAQTSMREFKHYTRDPQNSVAEAAVRAIEHCVRTQPDVAPTGLSALMRLLKSRRETLVAQAVIGLKSVILSLNPTSTISSSTIPDPQRLVARLAKGMDGVSNPAARASVFWLVGQYAATDVSAMGMGWEGVAGWVPDVLRKGVKGFVNESPIVKLQLLTLTTKLLVLSPTTSQLLLISQYLFTLARYDADYDVRDRARFLHALLRGVRNEKVTKSDGHGHGDDEAISPEDEKEEEDVGGVVLRREQVKVILLGKRQVGNSKGLQRLKGEYQVGSMSQIIQKRLEGYEPLPEWTDDPTDSSLRESDLGETSTSNAALSAPSAPTPVVTATPPPIPVHVSPSAASLSRSVPSHITSPVGSILHSTAVSRAKFRDLDKFLDSESETEDEKESEQGSDEARPAPVRAPPRTAIVPEYDEDMGEEEEEESEDESDARASLYGQYR